MSTRPWHPLTALSPVDGRYAEGTAALRRHLSEFALVRGRVLVEVEWLLMLAEEPGVAELGPFSAAEAAVVRDLAASFDLARAERVKEIEATTRHDVKAVELYLRERLTEAGLTRAVEWVHFGATSEDISNLARAVGLRDAMTEVWLPAAAELVETATLAARRHRALPMAGRTHGQPATPTTVGKELAVFAARWHEQAGRVAAVAYRGKFGGAVGTFGAGAVAYPDLPWPDLAQRFVARLGLTWIPLTTQIDPHDWLVELLQAIARFTLVVRDFAADVWAYLARGVLRLVTAEGEVGSSTMPHKVNPAVFENAEANASMAAGLADVLVRELPVSRLQRDLADSSRLRNVGPLVGHSLLAVTAATRGLRRLVPDEEVLGAELAGAWDLLGEAIQTVMRKHGLPDGYTRVRAACAEAPLDQARTHALIRSLGLPADAEHALLALTPAGYTGLAAELVDHLDD